MKLSDTEKAKERFLIECNLNIQKKYISAACESIYISAKNKLRKELESYSILDLVGEGNSQKDISDIIRKYFYIEDQYYSNNIIKELKASYVQINIDEIRENLSEMLIAETDIINKMKDIDKIKAMTLFLIKICSQQRTDLLGEYANYLKNISTSVLYYVGENYVNAYFHIKGDAPTKKIENKLKICIDNNLFSKEIRIKAYKSWIQTLQNFLNRNVESGYYLEKRQIDLKEVFDNKLLFINILETIFEKNEAEEILASIEESL